jgi:hypothetical protein
VTLPFLGSIGVAGYLNLLVQQAHTVVGKYVWYTGAVQAVVALLLYVFRAICGPE